MYSDEDKRKVMELESRLERLEEVSFSAFKSIITESSAFNLQFMMYSAAHGIEASSALEFYEPYTGAFDRVKLPFVAVDYAAESCFYRHYLQGDIVDPDLLELSRLVRNFRREVSLYEFVFNSVSRRIERIYSEIAGLAHMDARRKGDERHRIYMKQGLGKVVKTECDLVRGAYCPELQLASREEIEHGLPRADVVVDCPSEKVDLRVFLPFVVERLRREYMATDGS